jgi:hypothetical protein
MIADGRVVAVGLIAAMSGNKFGNDFDGNGCAPALAATSKHAPVLTRARTFTNSSVAAASDATMGSSHYLTIRLFVTSFKPGTATRLYLLRTSAPRWSQSR